MGWRIAKKNSKPLVWDTTYPDTLAQSYCYANSCAEAVAEERKPAKYTSLWPSYSFTPVSIKTLGNWEKVAGFFAGAGSQG